MDIFIGDKEEFGVEIKSANLFNNKNPYGHARIWFGGNFFGSIHDAIYLDGYLLGGLFEIDKVPFFDSERLSGDCKCMFEYFYKRLLNEDDAEVHSHLINFGTLTDPFTVFAFKYSTDITVLWKRNENLDGYSRFEDLKNYPLNVYCYTMDYSTYRELLEQVERFVVSM